MRGADRLKRVAALVVRHRQVRRQTSAHTPAEPLDDPQLLGRRAQHRRDDALRLGFVQGERIDVQIRAQGVAGHEPHGHTVGLEAGPALAGRGVRGYS